MEAAKRVTAGWLARQWRVTAWIWRAVLVALVAGVAVINAISVYAQLVAAHIGDRGAVHSAIEMQDAALAARIEVAAHNVADLDRRLGQIDRAIEEAANRGKTNTALAAIESQRRARVSLVDGRPKPPDRDRGRAHPLSRGGASEWGCSGAFDRLAAGVGDPDGLALCCC
jgi:hypothetical protein